MTLETFCREVYQYFFQKIYGQQANTTRKQKSVELYELFVQNALKKFDSIGGDFVWLYVTYQFGRFERAEFRPNSFTKQVDIVNVFGQTAFNKFLGRRQDLDDLMIKGAFMSKFSISKEDFTKKTQLSFTLKSKKKITLRGARALQAFRSPVKESASKTSDIEVCEELTDLYNDQDPSCQKCSASGQCKLLLQKLYPHLYKLKGYE